MNKGLKVQIQELYNKGLSYSEIAKALSCSKAIISYHCQKHKNKENKYTVDKIEKYLEYYATGASIKEVAAYFGLGKQTLSKYIREKRKRRSQPRAISIENRKTYRNRVKDMAVHYKGGKCVLCGYSKCSKALHFHHLNPKDKDFTISGGTRSFENIREELDKCILVCSNCHAEIHAGITNCDVYPLPDKQ